MLEDYLIFRIICYIFGGILVLGFIGFILEIIYGLWKN
jgi:hypothetical protein